jgi:hypothetical protein
MGQGMSDAPRQPPPKKEVALALLQESSMFIHLDPRRPDVVVPKWFMGQPQLVLQVGLNMAIPIPDLKVDEVGVSCTLSFNRAPFWCRIPWSAVYALVGEDGRGGVWADDVPPEIQQQKQGPPQKGAAAKKGRPKLTAVGSGRSVSSEASSEGASEAPSEGASEPEEEVKPMLTPVPSAASSKAADDKPRPRPRAEPLRRVPAAAPSPADDDGILEDEPVAAREGRAQPAEEPAEQASGSPSSRPSQPPPGKKPKREIPPWLRVIK